MEKTSNSNFVYISLVAIVAIVAMVVLLSGHVMRSSPMASEVSMSASSADGGNMGGQAMKSSYSKPLQQGLPGEGDYFSVVSHNPLSNVQFPIEPVLDTSAFDASFPKIFREHDGGSGQGTFIDSCSGNNILGEIVCTTTSCSMYILNCFYGCVSEPYTKEVGYPTLQVGRCRTSPE